VSIDPDDPHRVTGEEELFADRYGRLRDVQVGPDGALYLLTSNRDGRGSPVGEDDRVLRVSSR
jgi:glucose/arabinose dehydrogenase